MKKTTTKTFVILGMHRSATSLIAGALNNFGVNMGEKLLGGRGDPKIKSLIERKKGLWGWKDPRTTLTIKLYLPYLKNPHFICCFREPIEVAKSLYRRQKMPIKKGLKLAKIYNKRLLKFLREIYENPRLYHSHAHCTLQAILS